MNNAKGWWIALGVAVVIVIIAIAMRSNKGSESEYGTSSSPTTSATSLVTISPVATPKLTLSYTNALKLYEGKRIQFDTMCQANPNRMVLKSGAKIMLDNRSATPRTIALGGTKYTLAAWGYLIVTPRVTKALPETILVDCGTSQNVATLIIEK